MSGNFSIRWDERRGSLDGRPTMWNRRLVRVRGWTIDLHKFVGPDDPGCFRTHPSRTFRLVQAGGYVEEVEGGRRRVGPGSGYTWVFGIPLASGASRLCLSRNPT